MDIQEELYNAIENNDIEKVKILLKDKRIDPDSCNNEGLLMAVYLGYTDIIELLIKDNRTDPTFSNNFATILASENKQLYVVNLLWQDQRVKNTLNKHAINLYNELVKKDKLKQNVEVF